MILSGEEIILCKQVLPGRKLKSVVCKSRTLILVVGMFLVVFMIIILLYI